MLVPGAMEGIAPIGRFLGEAGQEFGRTALGVLKGVRAGQPYQAPEAASWAQMVGRAAAMYMPPDEWDSWISAVAFAVPPAGMATGGLPAAIREAKAVARAIRASPQAVGKAAEAVKPILAGERGGLGKKPIKPPVPETAVKPGMLDKWDETFAQEVAPKLRGLSPAKQDALVAREMPALPLARRQRILKRALEIEAPVVPEAVPVKGVQLLEAQLKDPQYLRARIIELEKQVASPKISPQKRIDTRIELTQMRSRLEAIEGVPAVPAEKLIAPGAPLPVTQTQRIQAMVRAAQDTTLKRQLRISQKTMRDSTKPAAERTFHQETVDEIKREMNRRQAQIGQAVTEAKPPEAVVPGMPKVAGVAKEPWQMTQREAVVSNLADTPGFPRLPEAQKERHLTGIRTFHEQVIRRAVEEGKPVPPEVLADYPELAAQAGKVVPPAAKPPGVVPPVGPKAAPEALEAQQVAYAAANREEYAQFLARATRGMRPDQRAAYTKWFMEGRSEAEAAAIETRAGEILSGAKPGAAKPPVPEAVKPPPAGPPPGAPPPVGPPQPPSITPGPMAGNIIGLRAITPGLVRSEVVGNIARRTVSRVLGKIGLRPMVEAEQLATPAMRERARVQTAIGSQSALVGTKAEHLSRQAFTFDKQGRIPSLAGVNPDIPGAPTLADVAARLPTYEAKLTPAQLKALRDIEALVSPYKALLEEVGVEVRLRPDVMEGGFYLPRGRAALEGADEPLKVGAGLGKGVKKGFERPALFTSQAEGITKGYEYAPLSEALGGYAHDAGVRATDAHIVNYFKALTDETGRLVGETPKMRLMRQNPQIATEMETLKAQLDRLKRLRGALTERQQQVIDLWQHDPEFDDLGVLLEGLATMKAGKTPGMTRTELSNLFKETRASIQKLMPQYKAAQRRALLTPREQGAIGLPGLQGWTWPDEVANAANIVLSREGPTRGALAPAVNVLNAFNNLYRGLRATLDDSAIAIQGLLGIGAQPRAYRDALKVNIRAWGVGGDKVLGKFIADFDTLATQTGRMPSGEWAKAGLQVGGAVHEFTLGLGTKIATLPGIRQANRAFGFFGDALRLRWADNELAGLLAKGKSLAELKASGELERIATAANNMTGWAPGKAMASFGDLLLFAPRFLQARLETVTRAAMSLRPHATRDQVMARTALLRLISWGTMVTVAVNEALGNDTDFRWLVDGKRNPNFMRISFGGRKYSVFGTWDSLAGALTNVATGRPLNALRAMSSGTVAMSWDVLTGRDWNYRPVRETPGGLAKWFLGSFVPFAAEEIPALAGQVVRGVQEKKPVEAVGGAVALGGEVLGVKSYPLSPPRTLAETAENKKQKALAAELKRLEVSSGRVTAEIAGKKLTPEERNRYQETTDTLMLAMLPRMLSKRTYQKLSDDNKKWAIEMLMSASREEARGIVTGKLTEKGSQSRLKQEMNDTLEAAKERRPKKTPYWGK